MIDTATIKQAAAGRWLEILVSLGGCPAELLDGRHYPCPRCGGKDRFRLLDAAAGALLCNQCFAQGNGDGIAALRWLRGWGFKRAVAELARYLGRHENGREPAPGSAAPRAKKSPRTYPTAHAAIAALVKQRGKPSKVWKYHNSAGEMAGAVIRWDGPDGKKIMPISPDGKGGWTISGMATPRPLYALPDLAGADRVVVTEGEKAADAAKSIGLTATTSPHGSKSAKYADWFPLAGKGVVIVPDHDADGEHYASEVAKIVTALKPPATVKIVRLPRLPAGGDVVEWLGAGGTREAFDALVDAAPERERLADVAVPINSKAVGRARGPVLVKLADVKPEPIRWLWPGRIALGKLTLLAGDPNLGKSLLTLDMAARVSRGLPWPDQSQSAAPIGGVVLRSAEDDLADTIRPRLDAARADVSRIVALTAVRGQDDEGQYNRPVDLSRDLQEVEAAIEQVGDCRLVIIDPLTAYLGRTDSHVNAEVRGLLAPLAELAGRRGVAVVAVTHLRKGEGPAMYRSMGSLAFVAAARAVWAVGRDKEDPSRRLLLPVKNNLAPDGLGLAFKVEAEPEGGKPVVAWEAQPVSVSADDALGQDRSGDGERGDRAQAADWLREALAAGPMRSADVLAEGKENGFTEKTLRRAYRDIGGRPEKESFAGPWHWGLPAGRGQDGPEDGQDAQDSELGILGKFGHLGAEAAAEECDEWVVLP